MVTYQNQERMQLANKKCLNVTLRQVVFLYICPVSTQRLGEFSVVIVTSFSVDKDSENLY